MPLVQSEQTVAEQGFPEIITVPQTTLTSPVPSQSEQTVVPKILPIVPFPEQVEQGRVI